MKLCDRVCMSALTKYNAARTALAEAHAVDEVKDIRDKAEAMAAYARQAKDTELLKWVTEIKVRAERRAGQMLAEMPKNPGELRNSPRSHDVTTTKTLSELGITKNESSRWQKLAGVSDENFEHAVAAAKEVAGEVTTAAMLRVAKEQETPEVVAPVVQSISDQAQVTKADPAPYDPQDDEIAGLHETVRSLADENDALKDQLLASDQSEQGVLAVAETIAGLRAEIKLLEVTISALTASRDSYQRDNAELKNQCASQRKQIAKLQKVAA